MDVSIEQGLRIVASGQLLLILAAGVWLVGGARHDMPRPLPAAAGACIAALAVLTFGLLTNLATDAPLTPGLLVAAAGLLPCTAVTAWAVWRATRRP